MKRTCLTVLLMTLPLQASQIFHMDMDEALFFTENVMVVSVEQIVTMPMDYMERTEYVLRVLQVIEGPDTLSGSFICSYEMNLPRVFIDEDGNEVTESPLVTGSGFETAAAEGDTVIVFTGPLDPAAMSASLVRMDPLENIDSVMEKAFSFFNEDASVFNNQYEDMYRSLLMFYYPGSEQVMLPFGPEVSDGLHWRSIEYAARWSGFRPELDFSGCEFWVDSLGIQYRAGMTRGIISLIDWPGIDSLASDFVSSAPYFYEWEGDPEAIGMEIEFAMSYLETHPDTPLEPYLLILLMHRLRARMECEEMLEGEATEYAQALYDSISGKALSFPDPLVVYFANELDSVEYVYIPQ